MPSPLDNISTSSNISFWRNQTILIYLEEDKTKHNHAGMHLSKHHNTHQTYNIPIYIKIQYKILHSLFSLCCIPTRCQLCRCRLMWILGWGVDICSLIYIYVHKCTNSRDIFSQTSLYSACNIHIMPIFEQFLNLLNSLQNVLFFCQIDEISQ